MGPPLALPDKGPREVFEYNKDATGHIVHRLSNILIVVCGGSLGAVSRRSRAWRGFTCHREPCVTPGLCRHTHGMAYCSVLQRYVGHYRDSSA
jgi:hypothetical protein